MFLILRNIVIYGQQTICNKTIKNYSVDHFENNGNGTSGSTYHWEILENNFNQFIYNSTSGNHISIDWSLIPNGTYTLQVTESGICNNDIKNISINVLEEISAHLAPNYYLCPNNDLIISTEAGDYNYQWLNTNQQLIGTANQLTINTPGNYQLIVSNEFCSKTIETTVTLIQFPTFSIQQNPNGSIQINLNEGNSNILFQLEDNQNNILKPWQESNQFSNLIEGNYKIKLKTIKGGCITSLDTKIFNLPSFLSPNQDGINDYWDLSQSLHFHPQAIVTIFDRFGKQITQLTKNENFIWNGTQNGKSLTPDSYWYIIDLKNGQKISGYLLIKQK